MKKKPFRHTLIPILIAALLCTAVPSAMILTGHEELLRNTLGSVLVPVEGVFSRAGNGIRGLLAYFTEFDDLKAENERLRARLASMEDKVRAAELALEENEFLSGFLDLRENHDDYRFLKCTVVAEEDTGYRLTLTLNAGGGEGVSVGNPVITEAGVVGRITEVGSNWSKAEPITALSSSVGAYVERTGTSGVAEGDYGCLADGNLLLSYLPLDAEPEIGDRVRTSGVNSTYPRGLLLGEITALRIDPATMQPAAVLTPAVSTEALRDVMIITDFARYEESGETEEPEKPEVSDINGKETTNDE